MERGGTMGDLEARRPAARDGRGIPYAFAALPLATLTFAAASVAGFPSATRVLDVVCHRIPARSVLFTNAPPLPLCARCMGLWVGALAGALLAARLRALARTAIPRSWWPAALATAVGVADGLASTLLGWETSGGARLASGALLGGGAFYLATSVAMSLVVHSGGSGHE